MRMPFERLMERVAGLAPAGCELTLGELSDRWGEEPGRIADAVEALKLITLLGAAAAFEAPGRARTYISI